MSCYHGSKMFGLQQTKNPTQKVNSPCYKLHQSYSISFNLFRKKKICVVFIYFLKQARIKVSCRSRTAKARKCTKKRDACAKLLFC